MFNFIIKNDPIELISAIRNLIVHYDQQPLAIRKHIFGFESLDTIQAKDSYFRFWENNFSNFIHKLICLFDGLQFKSLSRFYISSSKELLSFNTADEHFAKFMDIETKSKFFLNFEIINGKISVTGKTANESSRGRETPTTKLLITETQFLKRFE
jgi:hypothetical protein